MGKKTTYAIGGLMGAVAVFGGVLALNAPETESVVATDTVAAQTDGYGFSCGNGYKFLLTYPEDDYEHPILTLADGSVSTLTRSGGGTSRYESEDGTVAFIDQQYGASVEVNGVALGSNCRVQSTPKPVVPDTATEQADMQAIRSFMANSSLSLEYTTSRSPANFTIGKVEPLSTNGDARMVQADEWKRSVNVYRATEEIENTCEVYEYEVYPKTHEVVQVHVVYPDSYSGRCDKGTLFTTQASDEEIRTTGESYLQRIVSDYSSIKNDFTVTPLGRAGEGASRWEWKWMDSNYQLPAGLSGSSAVDSQPTIRLHIASSGKLLQYNNTAPLFE